ncbi:hypothetical protein MIND_00643100 [Mycena indigotica]|uniref:Uncharacterized protein n=1 Tax=Mycena indigotica TaxID=2126181 RepID=A0A8H6SQE1_9AGAR|nr:uncharacterized protein MIND_00643100 [Mycena indigotica]KAF7304115.1 hypothetical protein MIND_00643100 [Mycena indigotica]
MSTPSPSPTPASGSPSRSIRSRMGGVMRRTSSILAMANPASRPTTPAVSTDDVSRRSSASGPSGRNADAKASTTSVNSQAVVAPAPVVAAPSPATAPVIIPAPPMEAQAAPAAEPQPTATPTTTTSSVSVEPEASSEATAVPSDPAPPVLVDSPPPVSADTTPTASPPPSLIPKPSPAIKRLLPVATPYSMHPSPIMESPAREAEANAEEAAEAAQRARIVGPAPLGPAVAAVMSPPTQPELEPVPADQPVPTEEAGYVPPPLVFDSSNPGAFTDEPEAIPIAPAAVPVVETSAEPAIPVPKLDPSPSYFDLVPPSTLLHPIEALSPDSVATIVPGAGQTTVAAEEEWQRAVKVEPFPYDAAGGVPVFVAEPTPMANPWPESGPTIPEPAPAVETAPAPSMPEPVLAPVSSSVVPQPVSAPVAASVPVTVMTDSPASLAHPRPLPSPHAVPPILSEVDVQALPDMDDGQPALAATEERKDAREVGQGGWWEMAVDGPTGVARAIVIPDPAVQFDNQDPFADPPPAGVREEGVYVVPVPVGLPVPERGYDAGSIRDVSTLPIPVPKDALFGSIRTVPSAENIPLAPDPFFERVVSDDQPLLGGANSHHSHHHHHRKYHSTATGTTLADGPDGQSLHDLGWLVYALPDGLGVYFVHPSLKVITDADLRVPVVLARIGRAVGYGYEINGNGYGSGEEGSVRGKGREVWLREVPVKSKNAKGRSKGKGKGRMGREDLAELGLARWWIDHGKREVVADEAVVNSEDHLDKEYRYWAFVEAHPAHSVVPFSVRKEAVDLLTWAWTDRLLPPAEQPTAPPFTQSECQELLGVLRSFGDVPQQQGEGIQSVVLTRLVSRIMLRLAHWRQHHFRPHKPLPLEAHQNKSRSRGPGFVRRALDALVAALLLGVPFLFYHKHVPDAEGGRIYGQRSILPMLVVGAATCLLAALLLSTSMTFLTLPGLASAPRIGALAVAVCAAGAVVAGLVALLRLKADQLAAARLSDPLLRGVRFDPAWERGEGMMLVSTRSVVMSLPLVLLVYALLGFVAVLALYAAGPPPGAPPRVGEVARYVVLGLIGGLGGVLAMSLVLLRR